VISNFVALYEKPAPTFADIFTAGTVITCPVFLQQPHIKSPATSRKGNAEG